MCSSDPYATSALEGDGSQRQAWPLEPEKEIRYSLYRRLGKLSLGSHVSTLSFFNSYKNSHNVKKNWKSDYRNPKYT